MQHATTPSLTGIQLPTEQINGNKSITHALNNLTPFLLLLPIMTNDDDPSGSTPEPPGLQSPPPLPPQPPPEPAFPAHDEPRVWLISSGDSPIGITVSRQVLEHGDYVVSGLVPASLTRAEGRREQFTEFMEDIEQRGWKERFRPVALDIRFVSYRGFPI